MKIKFKDKYNCIVNIIKKRKEIEHLKIEEIKNEYEESQKNGRSI